MCVCVCVFWRVFRGAGEDEIGVVKKTIAEKHKTEGEKSLPSLAPSPSPKLRYEKRRVCEVCC